MSWIQRSFNTLQYYAGTQNGVLIVEVSAIQRSLTTLQYYAGTQNGVLIVEVSTIQRSFNTLQYYAGTQNGVLIVEVSAIHRFVIEMSHCNGITAPLCMATHIRIYHIRIYLCMATHPSGQVTSLTMNHLIRD